MDARSGVEALVLHLETIDSLNFTTDEKAEARSLFNPAIRNMCAAIRKIAANNGGRIPFKVDHRLQAVGEVPDFQMAAPADLFCGKGLLVSPQISDRKAGRAMLPVIADRISTGRIEHGTDPTRQGRLSQSMRMLFLSIPRLLEGRVRTEEQETLWSVACDYIECRHSKRASIIVWAGCTRRLTTAQGNF